MGIAFAESASTSEASVMIVLRKHLKVSLFLPIGLLVWAMVSGPTDTIVNRTAHAAQTPDQILDLVFVIDNSGSMKKNDPNFISELRL